MAAVNGLHVAAASTAASAAALQWWAASVLDEAPADGGDWLAAVLRSRVTVALLANLAAHLFLLLILALKTLFFVQLTSLETRKVLEHIINYVIYKGTFLPLVVPPSSQQMILWSTWLVILCSLKMFQSLARERLEQLNASPSATPSKYFRVYSALLLVLSTDILWMRLCVGFCSSCNSKLFWLLFFEPLGIAFETLQSIMVHGFQLFDIWQRQLMDSGADFFDFQKSYKQAAGSFSELRGKLVRNFGFAIDLISLSMSLGHYSMIFWLRGMAFHLVDAVLLLNLRALIVSFLKRIRSYIKSRKALNSLDGSLPDATYDEICEYDDECAICRGPMARAKKLSCNHLFHLACLRSWLDQGLMDGYSCPTCRRPLFLSSEGHVRSTTAEVENVPRITEQFNMGRVIQQRVGNELPVEQHNASDAIWSAPEREASRLFLCTRQQYNDRHRPDCYRKTPESAMVRTERNTTRGQICSKREKGGGGVARAGGEAEAANRGRLGPTFFCQPICRSVPLQRLFVRIPLGDYVAVGPVSVPIGLQLPRGGGLDASWVPPWSSPGMDNPSSSTAMRSVGLTGVQMMMRQLASVSDSYGHTDATWNLWPDTVSGSSPVPSSSSLPNSASGAGLRLRGTAGAVNGSMTELLTMLARVREVLPHISDELIMEDLMRTHNINATVNNLLLMQ